MELNMKRCVQNSKKFNKNIDTITNIMDLSGLSLTHLSMLYIVRMFNSVDEPNYPERLGSLYLINCSSIFPSFWNLIKSYLSPVTVEKIHILGTDYSELLLTIDSSQLPKEYGGSCNACSECLSTYSDEKINDFFLPKLLDSCENSFIVSVGKFEIFEIEANFEKIYYEFNCSSSSVDVEVNILTDKNITSTITKRRTVISSVWWKGCYSLIGRGKLQIKLINPTYFVDCIVKLYHKKVKYFENIELEAGKEAIGKYLDNSKEWI